MKDNHHLPKLSVGPVLYYWDKKTMYDFYDGIAKSKVDIVYLGETVCSKRKLLRKDDWLKIAKKLQDAGKEVVLSGMTLIEANSELAALRSVCNNGEYLVEANDIAAVQMLQGKTFVTGPAINIYNPHSLQVMADQGMRRWVMSVELSRQALADMQKDKPKSVETEVFVYGRLPLAYSARCFTARAHNLPKDDCQYRCLDYPDGFLLSTQENEKFLILNGIQTQSSKTCNLISELDELIDLKVDVLRISPSSKNTEKVISVFHQYLHEGKSLRNAAEDLEKITPASASCNGYWYGVNGMDYIDNVNKENIKGVV